MSHEVPVVVLAKGQGGIDLDVIRITRLVLDEETGRRDRAISSFREALRIRPDYPEAWNNLGVVHQRLGQYPLAISCYREALRIRPDLAEARKNLAVAYREAGLSP